ncbi:DUF2771 domain-containing protein [Corynebacterium afermentans]|uniref:DUF2771 family protein n=1 Tax=Corynebacterium afermentans TaxID=38286 RepID=UPI002572A74C|nr:DUF2771 family protein [Corynebacterium afermentans]MCG7291010.1 DUF2771 domain-containing protein [Corynebacterium afermentans]
MAPKRAATQQWKVLAIALVGVVVLVGAVYSFMSYQQNKPGTPVRDLEVAVAAAGQTEQVPVYTVCELDVECPGGEPPRMRLPDQGDVTVTVPGEIERNSWRLLLIYDDPAANTERVFTSGESGEETVPAVTESGAKLVVAEITTLDIEKGDDGEETPVIATWSVGFD